MISMRGRISLNKGLVPLLISFLIIILSLTGCAENNSILDNRQSRQLEFSVSAHGWNNFNNSLFVKEVSIRFNFIESVRGENLCFA